MRLDDLNNCFDNAAPSSEQKQRMLGAILEQETEYGGVTMKRKAKRLTLAAALAAAFLLTATTALAVSNGWHEKFMEYFGIGAGQTNLLDGAVGTPGASVTENGVTVEVLQTLADGLGVYAIFEVTVPESAGMTDAAKFGEVLFTAEKGKDADGYRSADGRTVITDVSGNKITAVAYFLPNEPIVDGTLSLFICDIIGYENYEIPGLGYAPRLETFETLVAGEWSLKWDFTYTDTSKKTTPNVPVESAGDAVIAEIAISPVSISVIAEGTMRTEMESVFDMAVVTVALKDGSTIAYGIGVDFDNAMYSSGLVGSEGMLCRYRMFNRFSRIIDPDDVVSVAVGDLVIPIG
jgi:hypothetical protein